MKKLWTAFLTLSLLFVFAGLAFAQATAKPGDPPVEEASKLMALLLASGWLGGLWKGAVVGVLRGIIGYWSKDPEHPNTEAWDWSKLITAGIAGALIGLGSGLAHLSYEQASGWAAQFGLTEIVYRLVQAIWHRFAKPVAATVVAKAMVKKERMLAASPPAQK